MNIFDTYKPYAQSVHLIGDTTIYMTNCGETDSLVEINGSNLIGERQNFSGEQFTLAPLTHTNAVILRKLFPFTAPKAVLKNKTTVGVGDRLGVACDGHIRVFEKYDAIPVLAQQSIRELNLTDRTYGDVLDAATFAVFKNNFRKGFGADGDHLKTEEQIEYALSSGYTMITLDCSDYIRDLKKLSADEIEQKGKLDAKTIAKYGDVNIEGTLLQISKEELTHSQAIYGEAIEYIKHIYAKYITKNNVDFEISIDETGVPTTPAEHYFVAKELTDAGVVFQTLAPRFCGEFQKGIDYIGDLKQFEKELVIHNAIAVHFGYKLSIHSGSDKFSIFEIAGKVTQHRVHLKTAGTNWLEAMKLVAIKAPALYREIHKFALKVFDQATAYYHVTTDINKVPNIDKLTDDRLAEVFQQNDGRQLIHITYGLILSDKQADGSFTYRDRLYKVWRDNAAFYSDLIYQHIGKHLELLLRG